MTGRFAHAIRSFDASLFPICSEWNCMKCQMSELSAISPMDLYISPIPWHSFNKTDVQDFYRAFSTMSMSGADIIWQMENLFEKFQQTSDKSRAKVILFQAWVASYKWLVTVMYYMPTVMSWTKRDCCLFSIAYVFVESVTTVRDWKIRTNFILFSLFFSAYFISDWTMPIIKQRPIGWLQQDGVRL